MNSTIDDTLAAINDLDSNSASGPDGLPTILPKTCKSRLSKPLRMLFLKPRDTGIFLDTTKDTVVTPIHKRASKIVSLAFCTFKVVESIV